MRPAALVATLVLASPAWGEFPEVVVSGDAPLNGIFDPALAYAPDGTGWLTYSAVFGNVAPWGPHVETHLARSDDGGATWTFEQVVNPSTPGTLSLIGGGELSGVWNAEVSSLVYDPGDSGREWKVFYHRIFRKDEDPFVGEQNQPAYGWIGMRTAPDPTGTFGAEIALLSSGPLPPSPYNVVATALNGLDPSLSHLLVYSEPGGYQEAGVLYLSLTGLTAAGSDRIVLFASDDHGDSWRFVSTLLTNADAATLGYMFFDGSSIAADAGRVFLLVSPGTQTLFHDGTLVFEFESLASGQLVMAGGAPRVEKHILPQPGFLSARGGGQSAYHEENRAGGLLMPQINLPDFSRFLQIFATGERLAPAPQPVPFAPLTALLTMIVIALVGSRFARSS